MKDLLLDFYPVSGKEFQKSAFSGHCVLIRMFIWFVLVLHYKDVEKEQKKSTGLNLSVAFFELNRTI